MSDFLLRLAERALSQGALGRGAPGAPSQVQPKLPRRFAPLQAAVDPAMAWWREELARHRSARPAAPAPSSGEQGAGERGPGERLE